MKKYRFLAYLLTLCAGAPVAADAAYPVYQGGYVQSQYAPQPAYVSARQAPVYQQPGPYMPVQQVIQNPAAAQPTRITGGIPRVGSNTTASGRQYYQPQNFDRLSDSGLYIGLSAAYSSGVNGGMHADYVGEDKSWVVPGSFQESSFRSDTVIPLQLSIGAAINNDVRVDFSYTRYSGIAYASDVQTGNGAGGYIAAKATGGAVSSSATMLNLYYNIDSYTGMLGGGGMRPYIGIGVGIASNTVSDYLIFDKNFYSEVPEGTPSPGGQLTAISDIYAYHAGGTMEQLAYMFEGGISTELEGGIKMDFFVRYSGLGKVQSSGSIVVSQTEWLGTGYGVIGENGAEEQAPYDSVFHYTNWYESGSLGSIDVGIRMRLQF